MKRMKYIDNAKGILVLLMVIAHIFQQGYLYDLIYTFHMPAFFVINGFLLQKTNAFDKPIYEFLKSRIMSIIIPFLFFEVMGILIHLYVYGILLNPIGYLYGLVNLTYYNDPCWFLIAVFLANIMFYFLQKIKSKRAIITIVIIISSCSYFVTSISSDLRRAAIALLFLAIGYYAKEVSMENSNRIALYISIIILLIIASVNGDTSFVAFDFKNPFLYVIGAISGTYMVLYLSKKMNFAPLEYFGKNSLVVMATHWLILMIIHKHVETINLSVQMGMVALVLVIVLEFPITYCMNKYIPFLVGKK